MRQLSRSKAAVKLFTPIAFAVGLMCWGSVAVAAVDMFIKLGDVRGADRDAKVAIVPASSTSSTRTMSPAKPGTGTSGFPNAPVKK